MKPVDERSPDVLSERIRNALGEHFVIERELRGGGMSRVFLAEEKALSRRVVIKVLPPDLAFEGSAERFRQEVRIAARLQHPHIVPLLSAGEASGLLYYTMPFVAGESLRGRLERDGALGIREAVRLLRDLFDALACAHEAGFVHRDMKPENVLLSQDHAVITDFGVAKAIAAAAGERDDIVTGAGLAIGTAAYMAPEQAAGDPHVDHRADIYATGVLAYEMLTGGPPFSGMPAHAVIAAHATTAPDHITLRRRTVPVRLAELVMRCLEKHPADRPQSAREAIAMLDSVALSTESPAAGDKQGPRRKVVIGVVAGLALVAALAAARLIVTPDGFQGRRPANSASQSLAVLPFRNLSGGAEADYFADGMTEELIGALTRVDGLQVAPRSSAFAFKTLDATPAEIRGRLRVANFLEGSVQRSGTRLRVTVQLVDAHSERTLWSEKYDREMADVFAVQDDIARAIVSALRVRLSPLAQQRLSREQTTDVEAYNAYLRGRYHWNKRSDEGFRAAIGYFEDAVRRDSTFARAYSGLADAHTLVALNGYGIPAESFPKAKAAALRALSLNPELAEGYASLGLILHVQDWDWSAAETAFKRAIQLDPGHAHAHHWYGMMLTAMGRNDEAIAEARRAYQLDPLSLPITADLGQMLFYARNYPAAIEQLRRTIELDSTFARGHGLLGQALLVTGDHAAALQEIRTALRLRTRVSESWGQPALANAYMAAGQSDSARAVARAVARWENPAEKARALALIYSSLGDMDLAFLWLHRALDQKAMIPTWLRNPVYDPMRRDPRWAAVQSRLGLDR